MTSTVTSSGRLLRSLIRSNQGILEQKLSLLNVLQAKAKHGTEHACNQLFTKVCPIVGASIGAHYRHSMDHIELSVLVASNSSNSNSNPVTLNYDLRVRGGTLEKDVNEARKRIQNTHQVLEEMMQQIQQEEKAEGAETKTDTGTGRNENLTADQMVHASFMLSSDSSEEFNLPSTIGRELGFVAHHAIHHLAMVRIIATETLGLEECELPPNFGKAPSTVRFEDQDE